MSILKNPNKNFLGKIIVATDREVQYKLKSELDKKQLWERFYRTQIVATKESQFDAEILGVIVKVIIPEKKQQELWKLPDLEKLYVIWAELQESEKELVC